MAVGAGGTLLERGSYTALPHTLELGTAGDDVTYAVSVDGPAEVDTGGTVESGDETTLSGTVSSGETHTYRFAGDVTDLVVRSGALRDLRAELDGVAVSVERLQAQSWREADSPTDVALYDVVRSAAGPCAVGGGGRVLIRRPSGWLTAVSDGPTGESATLFGAGATDDGRHVWVAGASGVVGRYDVATGELEDHTLPNRPGATWEAVDAAGTAGKETVLLVNGSGEVVIGGVGKDGVSWTEPTKPGGGSSMKGCSLVSPEVGHAVDTNSKVYRTEDGGQSWSVIGISGGSIGLYGVAAGGTAAGLDSEATTSADDLSVAGGDGSVYQYNGAVWTKNWASDAGLLAIDRLADRGVAVGAGGRIYRRGLSGWRAEDSPASTKLNAVALGKSGPDVAVGNNGTVLERD